MEIAPFSEVYGVHLTLTNTRLVATNVTFRNCSIVVAENGAADLTGCFLETTKVGTKGAFYRSSPLPVSGYPHSGTWILLKDCILSETELSYLRPATGNGTNLEGTFQLEQCTVYGPSSTLPDVPLTDSFREYVKHNELKLKACKFTDLVLDTAMLAISEDCIFENCRPGDGAKALSIPGVETLPVSAKFIPATSAGEVAAKYPQLRFTSSSLGKVGSSVAHTATQGVVKLVNQPPAGSLRENFLPTALVQTTPQESRTNPTGTPNEPAKEAEFTGSTTGTMGAPDSGLKLKQTAVNGLLIMSLASGEAGSAARMSAIALPEADNAGNSTLRFNQPVGPMMGKALEEVTKFTQLNSNGWPKGHAIEISFADKYSNKDGPSAAVACALLLHSLISGKELDPNFAVTGDMNADGSVQPIGGVAAKIRGATKGQCKLIGIPVRNESSLPDLLLMDGPTPFASIQIFGIGEFKQAEALALAQKPETTQAAIAEMNQVQELLMRSPAQMGSWLRNQHVIAKLQQVLKNAPNNLSAKYLLMYASGKLPQTLSLAGSIVAIDNSAGDLISTIKTSKGDAFNNIGKSSLGSSLTRLQGLRARCDARARPYADAIINFGTAVKEAMDRPAQTGPRAMEYRVKIRGAASSVESELSRLLNDPTVREELEG
ncbi:S16 family serine protease [Roseimicrobium gellanilyticum]|uniref:S16 family serine protease n=1 Tax=Roseimicrobium gellanilyticum TaxID=748857 RepID=UPI0014757653|nr:S16 family serine protease [Roseimicrobium gellanilyticum]